MNPSNPHEDRATYSDLVKSQGLPQSPTGVFRDGQGVIQDPGVLFPGPPFSIDPSKVGALPAFTFKSPPPVVGGYRLGEKFPHAGHYVFVTYDKPSWFKRFMMRHCFDLIWEAQPTVDKVLKAKI